MLNVSIYWSEGLASSERILRLICRESNPPFVNPMAGSGLDIGAGRSPVSSDAHLISLDVAAQGNDTNDGA